MFWLDLNLSLSDQFEVEKQVRYIQACDDLQELRHLAVELLRFSMTQAHVSNQLVTQVAEMECVAMGTELTAEHYAMADEILASYRANS